ncbi:MAG: sigma-70 family RNA polymerase sigma factor [Nitrosarchaeum sp.]|nr:sigma-70 family RNA polymerase sigma factor [Nitrosarchaeum sp.]
MSNTSSSNVILSDEQMILQYRQITGNDTIADNKRTRVFNELLKRCRPNYTSSWNIIIKKYVGFRLSKYKRGFDIYNEDDLCQRCRCCFYKAISEKFDTTMGVKFSTYIYTAFEKTVNRVLTELRKKKRTVEIDGRRVSPMYFTDSLQQSMVRDEKSITLSEVIADVDEDAISDDQLLIVESIMDKCKKYLTPLQYEIFINSDIQGIISGKEIASKYDKSEPTISAIKKRKIANALKRIRTEVAEEFKLVV